MEGSTLTAPLPILMLISLQIAIMIVIILSDKYHFHWETKWNTGSTRTLKVLIIKWVDTSILQVKQDRDREIAKKMIWYSFQSVQYCHSSKSFYVCFDSYGGLMRWGFTVYDPSLERCGTMAKSDPNADPLALRGEFQKCPWLGVSPPWARKKKASSPARPSEPGFPVL